jgi:hypothetical protein
VDLAIQLLDRRLTALLGSRSPSGAGQTAAARQPCPPAGSG